MPVFPVSRLSFSRKILVKLLLSVGYQLCFRHKKADNRLAYAYFRNFIVLFGNAYPADRRFKRGCYLHFHKINPFGVFSDTLLNTPSSAHTFIILTYKY